MTAQRQPPDLVLVDLVRAVGGNTYLTGQGARA